MAVAGSGSDHRLLDPDAATARGLIFSPKQTGFQTIVF